MQKRVMQKAIPSARWTQFVDAADDGDDEKEKEGKRVQPWTEQSRRVAFLGT